MSLASMTTLFRRSGHDPVGGDSSRRGPRRPATMATALSSAGVLCIAGVMPLTLSGTAHAADPPCTTVGTTTTCTYDTTGEHQFTVPAGVTSVEVMAIGGHGGAFQSSGGGRGARVSGNLTGLTNGQELYVEVGGNARYTTSCYPGTNCTGGFNGGGDSGYNAGGGGGASDLRTEPRTTPLTTKDSRLIVAAGGGGTGVGYGDECPNGQGGNAGQAGMDGPCEGGTGGGAGTATAGGAGGTPGGTAGALGSGGSGTTGDFIGAGGGGGGGLYGGGGGGGRSAVYVVQAAGGGGGGSSLVPFGGRVDDADADPSITITYALAGNTAPHTSLALNPSAPDGSNDWYKSPVTPLVTATDAGTGVAQTRCVLDPAQAPQNFAALPDEPCPYTGDDPVSGGEHTLYAASIDKAGNAEAVQSVTFSVDAISPVITCPDPAPAYTLQQSGATFTATATDAGSGLADTHLTGSPDTSTGGPHTFTATATDKAGNTTSRDCTYTVAYADTTTTLASTPNPSIAGQSVTFTATVTDPTPAGTVDFTDGTTVIGDDIALSGSSTATFTTSTLTIGSHQITAHYSGDATHNGSTSPELTQTVNALTCANATATITGTTGNDTLTGTPGDDVIFGLAGNDTINGAGGNDLICAGTGNDKITTGAGNDTIDAGDGTNTVDAGNGTNTVTTGAGNDSIKTGTGNDTINAGNGTNSVQSGAGNDTITTGNGTDSIVAGAGDDTVNAGNGTNSVQGDDGNDQLTTGTGTDSIQGGNGNDTIRAGTGTNTVNGGPGTDQCTPLGTQCETLAP
ncbi:calcium-binding protein [Streptomyces sp. NBC_01614]|uniref:calcium-binding protein n=1 Tax=Streptomyces sp. NBC_01614 TaxID=2975897 RepID=UPI003868AD8C